MALFVPVACDALLLSEDLPVPGPMMDFSKTPWTDGSRDYNADLPYLSETLYRKPFDDSQHFLKKGLHLHWALPDALTRSVVTGAGTDFPQAPNRWLIVRSGGGLSDRQWQVESDYLFPPGMKSTTGAISMPFQGADNEQPYRYMGRNYPLASSVTITSGEAYLEKLTAIGWGDESFAAFYPNCSSVFGFLDKEVATVADSSLTYQVIGYYSDEANDPYATFISDFGSENPQSTSQDYFAAIQKAFNWEVSESTASSGYAPGESIYFAELKFSTDLNTQSNSQTSDAKVTVANTGTEALSAFLANEVDPANSAMIEEQLEALQMTGQLSTMQLDVAANFLESRHTKGFSAVNAGTNWQLEVKLLEVQTANAEATQNAKNAEVPVALSQLLQKANALQNSYNRAMGEWQGMQKQLFADWHKYMAASYPPNGIIQSFPPIDLIKQFLTSKEIENLLAHQQHTGAGTLQWQLDEQGALVTASVNSESLTGYAGQTAFALNELIDAVNQFNQSAEAVDNKMQLSVVAGTAPRYWVPNEPVVCIAGEDAQPTGRHGNDGLLFCFSDARFNHDNLTIGTGNDKVVSTDLLTAITNFFTTDDPGSIGLNFWETQPWNPVLMEWEVAYWPLHQKSNTGSADKKYASDFVEANYNLLENAPDLSLKSGEGTVVPSANLYLGSTVMTPYASAQMDVSLLQGLNDSVMPAYFEAHDMPEDNDYLLSENNIEAVMEWYETTKIPSTYSPADKAADPLYSMLRSYAVNIQTHSLTQSLGGFNQALLQLEQTPQLEVAEPIGFASNQAFSQGIKELVGDQKALAPLPFNDFSPIRSGRFSLMKLRLVDSFGQVKDVPKDAVGRTELMNQPPLVGNQLSFVPRILQPSRLNFRWLDAKTDQEEMTLEPATSPVCGWMLPNHLDASLFFYNQAGEALGYIDTQARWHAAPGSESAIYQVEKIENPHLLKVVNYLLAQGADFFNDYLLAVNNAQDNIDPENYASVNSLSVLMGQPVAIVRAKLSLELLGHPAANQSWPTFQQDLSRNYRSTDHFEYVRFPVRIGEFEQLNDGTIGYWIEEDGAFKDNTFYAPESEFNGNEQIMGHTESDFAYQFNPGVGDVHLTLLMDPRGKLHATSGILPVKELSLPAVHYAEAMSRMEVSFLGAPILTNNENISIPTATQAGYSWSWVEKNQSDWNETKVLNTPRTAAVFEGGQRLAEGWLKLKPEHTNNSNEANDQDTAGFSPLGFEEPNNPQT